MRNLLILIFTLYSTNSFSLSQDFELIDSKNKKQKVNLNLLAGSICYERSAKYLVMYSYFGGNRTKEFYNGCAVVQYKLSCLGKILSSQTLHPIFEETFCIEPVKHNVTDRKIVYKSFTDKFECKKQFDELVMKFRENKVKCTLVKKGKLIDQFVDFENEDKKGIANEK